MASRTVDSLAALSESTEAMLQSIADLTDNGARGASILEGWTRGHVLTHVARDAEAMVNLVEPARTRTHIPMLRRGEVVSGPAPALLGRLIERTDGAALTTEGHLPQLGAWR
jgi:hypothetical protein